VVYDLCDAAAYRAAHRRDLGGERRSSGRRQHVNVTDGDAEAFEVLADRFCKDLEAGALEAKGTLTALVALVGAALQLPEVEPTDRDYFDPPDLDQACQKVVQQLWWVGANDFYCEVYDPRERIEPAVVGGRLKDDLGDIYRDLRRGLHIARSGAMTDAIWQWRFDFRTHWGNDATDAIRVLHRLVAD
jgi:hypothetical protein